MRRLVLVVLLASCILAGCASLDRTRATTRQAITHVTLGITRDEVMRLMGTETVRAQGHTITSPYRTETLQAKSGEMLEVLFYYTDMKSPDGAITDDELMPVVLKDGRVVGWGWSFLQDNVQKYEFRVR